MKILQIIFLVLIVSHKVLTNRLVENTTCLELAKPSNQQLRLTCSQYDYHCLLDDTFTKEFEVCREWKWIPGGKCAYFNTYGNGNVDERDCKPGINLTCSESNHQFESYKNTQFTACYKKKPIVTSIFTTISTSIQVTSNWTTNGDVETPSSTTEIWTVLPIVFGIIVPFLSFFLICSICLRLKRTKKGRIRDRENQAKNTACSDPVKSDNGEGKKEESEDIFYEFDEDSPSGRKSSIKGKIDDTLELQPLLEHLLNNPLTMKRDNGDHTPEEQKGDQENPLKNTTGPDNLKPDVEEEETKNSTDNLQKDNTLEGRIQDGENQAKNTAFSDSVKSDNGEGKKEESEDIFYEFDEDSPSDHTPEEQKGDQENPLKKTTGSDNLKPNVEEEETKYSTDNLQKEFTPERQKGDEEKPVKNTAGSDPVKSDNEEEKPKYSTDKCHEVEENIQKGKSDNEKENEEESTDIFGDTFESLQRIAPIEDEKGREECTNIYNLLENEGLRLAQKVMTAIIIKKTGQSLDTLSNNKSYEKEGKLKEVLPEHRTSFYVSYHLHQNFLDKKHHPKSGWGNPVREIDIDIGDDVERLNRIQTIVQKIPDPVTVSVESYIRLLDIMIEALTRLDHDAEFKEDFEQLFYKLKSIINPNLMQRIYKIIGNCFENLKG